MQSTAAIAAPPISTPPVIRAAMAGWRDLMHGAENWRLCYLLGAGEIRRRYARSRLGQLWIMISSAIMVGSMGLVWSYLWKQPVRELLPYVAIGMMTWQLIMGIITESAVAIPTNSRYFHNQYISVSTVIYALLYRNGVTFLLNLLFPLLMCVAFGVNIGPSAALSLVGLALLGVASLWVAFVVALVCTRFRDIVQIVTSSLQIIFFLTPVVWRPEVLSPNAQAILQWNPFAVFISVVRDPLLGRPVSNVTWVEAFALSFGGLALALPFIGRFRRRLIYWL